VAVVGWVETVPAKKQVAVVRRIEIMDELNESTGGEDEHRLRLPILRACFSRRRFLFKCALILFSITLKRTERGGGRPSSGNFRQSCSSSSRLNVMVDGTRAKKKK
jgi:hypothetical protein